MWKKLCETLENAGENTCIQEATSIIDGEVDVSKLKNTLDAAIREIVRLKKELKNTKKEKDGVEKQLDRLRNAAPLGARMRAKQVGLPKLEKTVKTIGELAKEKGEKYGR